MPIIVSGGQLASIIPYSPTRTWPTSRGVAVADHWQDYATIYKTQPNVRTVCDFVARNIAQLPLQVFRREGENDRIRVRDHPYAQFVDRPNPFTTRHRMVKGIMTSMAIYGEAIALKYRPTPSPWPSILLIPPPMVGVLGGLWPVEYWFMFGQSYIASGEPLKVRPDQVLHFRNYNPQNPLRGLSPIESLRTVLDEDLNAVQHRSDTWRNSGRQPAIIKRPRSAGKWEQPTAERFSELFTEAMRDPSSLTTPILEDDMDIMTLSFNAEQNQYAEGRKLAQAEVVTAYHVPLSMGGIADKASTFASVREYRKMLYVDCLGPWIDEIEEDFQLQMLPDFQDTEGLYANFNISEKLAGSFEEQAGVMQAAIGRPWMTPNEGRRALNLPAMPGTADDLALPLNISPNGDASLPAPAGPSTNGRMPTPVGTGGNHAV